MRIDLHAHTRASDGTETPAELVRAAAAAGLDVVAITDHDTTLGWAEAAAALPPGLALVRGAEISCRYRDVSLHLLGYLFDPSGPALADALAVVRDSRVPRTKAIVDRLRSAGVDVTWAEVLDRVEEGATVGRPHIADALVAKGVVADRGEAFREWLHSRSEFYVRHEALDPLVAIRAVRAAGGVPVLAHPFARHRGKVLDDSAVVAMASAGLAGLEVHHRDHSAADIRRLLGLAAELGLVVTGSSDYHGRGKANRLGEHLTAPAALEELAAQATGDIGVLRG
ncbi:PHP domain-containing protein [Motilibacter aurantiacus]|uniref:PHP domain-containing protein n=1 Tax=Motilibacter aurantiacus TaxID=2714955 RepID=UPI001409FC76|nr:PHP domain-containing protein [Motilibacter aurantiacus]NHC45682.1 PHP domain-containing protein [Motilibacter aurantiacus]